MIDLGNGVYRFMLDGSFRPGEVEVDLRGEHVERRLRRAARRRAEPRVHLDLPGRRRHGRARPHDPGERRPARDRGHARGLRRRRGRPERPRLPRGQVPAVERQRDRPRDHRRRRDRAPQRGGHPRPADGRAGPRRHDRHLPLLLHRPARRRHLHGQLPRRHVRRQRGHPEPGEERVLPRRGRRRHGSSTRARQQVLDRET